MLPASSHVGVGYVGFAFDCVRDARGEGERLLELGGGHKTLSPPRVKIFFTFGDNYFFSKRDVITFSRIVITFKEKKF